MLQKDSRAGTWGSTVREYYITEDAGWYSEREKWKKLKSFGMVHKRSAPEMVLRRIAVYKFILEQLI